MPSFKFEPVPEIKIQSNASTFKGEKNRTSYNYNLEGLSTKDLDDNQAKEYILKWTVPEYVKSFDVMEDRTAATDPVTISNVHNGYTGNLLSSDSANGLYIANPIFNEGQTAQKFEITITSQKR